MKGSKVATPKLCARPTGSWTMGLHGVSNVHPEDDVRTKMPPLADVGKTRPVLSKPI